jgi:AcrR family transcriptional regulator
MENAKEKMMRTYLELATEQPIIKIKVAHVTAAAGYNRCTFYQYFDDIYDLLDQTENMLIEEIKTVVMEAHSESTDYTGNIEIATSSLNKFSKYLYTLTGPNGSPSFQFKYKNALRPVVASVIRKHNMDFNDIVLEYTLGAFVSCVRYWYENQDTITPEELAEIIYKLTVNGV